MQKNEEQGQNGEQTSTMQSSFMKQNSSLSKSKKWPTSPPASPSTIINRHTSATQKSQTTHVNVVEAQSEYYEEEEDTWESNKDEGQEQDESRVSVSVKDRINRARARLRRLDTQNPRTPKTPQRQQL